jgi:dTDP-glucose 4,6-dehydratase
LVAFALLRHRRNAERSLRVPHKRQRGLKEARTLHQRDWIFVEDNCRAIALAAEKGKDGEVYNIAVGNSQPNLRVAELILRHVGATKSRIVFIEDRKGHDRMYKIASDKIRALGWAPRTEFADAMEKTVHWYVENRSWWERVKSGAFREYYETHYKDKLAKGKTR